MRMCVVFLILIGVAARLQAQSAHADVCITIDEARDTLSPDDRAPALLLVARQFEIEGRRVVSGACETPYTLSHIKLGDTIIVTLIGTSDRHEGMALGLDDLPAVYSQMVRSIVTGRAMTGFKVVDRTNVTASQATSQRVESDRFGYARIGYGGVFGDRAYGTPAIGLGFRAEFDSFGIDISFLNMQFPSHTGGESSGSVLVGSLLKLEGLYFVTPTANASAYVGGGLSWGGSSFGGDGPTAGATPGTSAGRLPWGGSGLNGELTIGYEMPRASTLRIFVQADVTLPFYTVASERYTSGPKYAYVSVTERKYAPSAVVSVGLGWQRNHRGRR